MALLRLKRMHIADTALLSRYLSIFTPIPPLCAAITIALALLGTARADTAQYFYDPAGRLTSVVDPVNGSAQYNYDATGNISSVLRYPTTSLFVAAFSPVSAVPGSSVTILGTGFGTAANTSVSFNGVAATPTSVTSTQITVAVPTGAAGGPISVTSPAGSFTTSNAFTLQSAGPAITSIPSGIVAQGTTITISGSGFDPNPANDVVTINGAHAPVTAATTTSLTVVAPPIVSNNPASVSTPYGVATSSTNLVIPPAAATAATVQSVTTTSLGSSITLSFDGTGHGVMASLPITASQTLFMSVTSADTALNGGSVYLYAPNGDALPNNYNLSEVSLKTGSNSYPIHALQAGTYAVWVTPPSGKTGSATIALVPAPPPVTGTLLSNGATQNFTVTTAGQSIILTFAATAGQQLGLNAAVVSGTIGGGLLPGDTLVVTGPTGEFFGTVFDYTTQTQQFSGAVSIPTTASGTYSVVYTPLYGETGTMAFTLYNIPPPATAVLSTNGSTQSLTTTTPGQIFAPTFAGTAGQQISGLIQTVSGTLGTGRYDQITISGPTGQVYSGQMAYYQNSTQLFTGPLTLPAGGTGNYTITDVPANLETGQLKFTVYTVPPPASATLTVGASPTTLTTTTPGQTFAATFTATASSRIAVDIKTQSGTLGTGNSDTIKITGPTGQIYSGAMSYIQNGTELFSGVLVIPATGTYTITDLPVGIETGSLAISVFNVPSDVTQSSTIGGSAVSLATTTPGQRIVLSFAGSAGQAASVLMNNLTGNISANGADITIIEPNGSTQLYSNWLEYSSLFTGSLILPTTGTYTLTFAPRGSEVGGATFAVYNDTSATSTLNPDGSAVAVTTTSPGQNMVLTLPETSGHRTAVLVQRDAGLSSQCNGLTVTAPDGTTVIFNNSHICQTSFFSGAAPTTQYVTSTELFMSQTGNYSVTLGPTVGAGQSYGTNYGTGTFTAYDVPADLTGTVTVSGTAAPFTLTSPGQSIRATFVGTASHNATVTVSDTGTTPTNPCYNVTVLEPNGTTILQSGQSCSSSYSTGSKAIPTSGSYLVVVTPVVPATGNFSVGVTSP